MNKRGKVRVKKICFTAICCFILLFIGSLSKAQQKQPAKDTITRAWLDSLTITVSETPFPSDVASVWEIYNEKLRPRPFNYLLYGEGTRYSQMAGYISADSLDAPISYSWEDSAVLMYRTRELWLYGNSKVKQLDMELAANVIHYDKSKDLIVAYGGVDTSNNPLNKPTMTQGDQKMIADTLYVNSKTKKGRTVNTYYNEGEIYVHADQVKKITDKESYAWNARFTTCNLDTPHFDFRTKKMKLITGKLAVSGPAWPEFEGVPMPVIIPFGIYPIQNKKHSGFLPPQFANNGSMGMGFEGIGYYITAPNDHWDLTTRANIYSYGGWDLNLQPRYFERYKYTGNLTLGIKHTKMLNESGTVENEFTISNTFSLNWSHTMDAKAHPGTSFSANVSLSSSQYNKYSTTNALQPFNNTMNSSITYAKNWQDGKYNLSVGMTHSQNNQTRLYQVSAPTVNFSMNTIYPFAPKEVVGNQKWYEKLGISYSGTFLNQVAFYDSASSFKRIIDTAFYGFTHSIPITLSLPALGPLLFSPSVSYSENWYSKKMEYQWNDLSQKVDTTISKGLYAARQMSFGISMNTALYGKFNFSKNSKIQAIQHTLRPTISANYQPNMQRNNYQTVQYDSLGHTMRVSKFAGNVVGAFSEGTYGGLSFGIDNMLEMKVRNDKDTTGKPENATKKVKLIDGFSLNTGYNFLADSLQWQALSVSLRTTLFDKLNITSNASLSPYSTDSLGRTTKQSKLLWARGSLGRFTSGNIAFSTSFSSKKKDGKTDQQRLDDASTTNQNMSMTDMQNQMEYVRNNPAEFVDFDIPWNVSASFALNFSRTLASNYRYYTNITSSLNLNGDFSISPKWKVGGNTMFDVKSRKIGVLTMFVTREMHCWQMAINITPIGAYKSFSIVLNPKSSILRDLKINRSRYFYNN